jgi:hypothetical protein
MIIKSNITIDKNAICVEQLDMSNTGSDCSCIPQRGTMHCDAVFQHLGVDWVVELAPLEQISWQPVHLAGQAFAQQYAPGVRLLMAMLTVLVQS